jgi:CsoR family transcriptional regulator, copper-sensing transcriptional repressor
VIPYGGRAPRKEEPGKGEHMYGYAEHKEDVLARLRKVEGQVRGIERMVSEDKYCIDILTQIAAASSALKRVAVGLLYDHVRHCVAEASENGGAARDEKVAEASAAIERLLKA